MVIPGKQRVKGLAREERERDDGNGVRDGVPVCVYARLSVLARVKPSRYLPGQYLCVSRNEMGGGCLCCKVEGGDCRENSGGCIGFDG